MSTVAIAAVGSRGDVAPLVGLGTRLTDAGHDVVIAAYTPFSELISGCGLRFRDIPVDFIPGSDLPDNPAKAFVSLFGPNGMRDMGRAVHAALHDEGADVLLLPPLSELAGHPLAEALGIPSIGVRMQPISATAAYPPTVMGAWSAGPTANRAASHVGGWVLDRAYKRVLPDLRRDLGLPAASPRRLRRARADAHWPVLHGYSPSVLPRPDDWRPGLEVVGYWWPPPATDWAPPAALTDFLDAGPAPVFVGFGSTTPTEQRAAELSSIVSQAFGLAGVRGIVQSGWAGLHVTADDVLTIGETPHEWLFPRMAAVAHHCGAGTTAAALRAGVPSIAMPGPVGDQPFWARRLQQLEASAATIKQGNLTAERLAEAMRTSVSNHQLRDTAAQLSALIATEDGSAAVLSTIETLLTARPR
ncbi:glycosyltransferase [Mycolicibacterium baixiangningiae]|uniref:glycosyltransferase n=1 Tax=Mycolicibacterium baixiangningiae TaxID=2761578 RepID=UPI001868ABEA|nr:glycosyltransferase [Mycolicibacterium baixiangningiae]